MSSFRNLHPVLSAVDINYKNLLNPLFPNDFIELYMEKPTRVTKKRPC